jgi:CheY-like chemotaxis protein
MASGIIDELRAGNPEPRVHAEVQDSLSAHADPRLLIIACYNLIGNARKFTRKSPQSSIQVGGMPGDQTFFVRNNGVGCRTSCSSPFQRCTIPQRSKARALASRPCSALFTGTPAGSGRKRRWAVERLKASSMVDHTGEKTLLLVEDNPNDELLLTIDALQQGNVQCKIEVARDAQEALDRCCSGVPKEQIRDLTAGLVLLDLKLSEVGGHDVLKRIRRPREPGLFHLRLSHRITRKDTRTARTATFRSRRSSIVSRNP